MMMMMTDGALHACEASTALTLRGASADNSGAQTSRAACGSWAAARAPSLSALPAAPRSHPGAAILEGRCL